MKGYNDPSDTDRTYTVFVMQSGVDRKDIYIAQTSKSPNEVVDRYNSAENPKSLPKPLGSMLPLTLREDLVPTKNCFIHQNEATELRRRITEEFESKPYTYNVRSKRSYFFGKKKSVKDKQTGKYKLTLDPSLFQSRQSTSIGAAEHSDILPYGRKKSHEWNDAEVVKLEQALNALVKKRCEDKE